MNRTTRILSASAALASIFTVPAFAAEPGFYLGASAGRGEEHPGKSTGLDFAIGFPPTRAQHIAPSRVDVDDGALAWSVAIGYRVNRYVAGEVEYIDFGTTDVSEHYSVPAPTIPILPSELTRPYSSRVKGPTFSVLGFVPLGTTWDVFLRGGVLFADREISPGGTLTGSSSTFGSTVWLAGAGIDWSFASRWALRAEYQRTGSLDATILTGTTRLQRASLSVSFRL